MPWVRFDDQFPIHRKVAGLSDQAYRLHTEAIFWCARNLTDGSILAPDLRQIAAKWRRPQLYVTELILRQLWHLADEECPSEKCPAPVTGDGWVIHDYWAYQPSKARVIKDREATAKRQADWRAAHSNGVTDSVTNPVSADVSHGVSEAAPARPVLSSGTGRYQGDRPRGRARDPDFTQNPNPGEGAAARHPSARTPAEAAAAAHVTPNGKPARGQAVHDYADQIRQAINHAGETP